MRCCRTSHIVVQIGAAAVPPIALLAAVHGIALAVRAGASGRVYCWAVSAVAAIGVGAFAVSFLALRDLMRTVGYSATTAWIFPALIDTAVAVSTLMLVALGEKPARRVRTGTASASTPSPTLRRLAQPPTQGAKDQVRLFAPGGALVPTSASVQPTWHTAVQDSAQTKAHGSMQNCTGRRRPCVGTDCIRCDHTACRDCGRGAESTP